ncbi:MAG: radical SAM family heme chaperone HemW [Deltaproteobacteria bacterium]|nr:radical SAM family heme chaperone HemW [Deltaproteobacteria bacterium]
MTSSKNPFSLYIHIPYCVSKCPYCDFNSHVVTRIPQNPYTDALTNELGCYAAGEDWQGRSLKTIFFGGGTPSTFSPESIALILDRSRSLFPFEKDVEITLEANPGTVDSKHFAAYRKAGVNRMSIGAQSFQPHLLKFLGRVHTADETRRSLRIVQEVGFESFNLDLIYAVPGQSQDHLKADLEEALSFEPPHLSAYNLTFEEGTPFERQFRTGKIRALPEEEEITMAELIEGTLAARGLVRYEISNYARSGHDSRHNVNYWQGGDYLGIGAGAHSYKQMRSGDLWGKRWQNEKDPGHYMKYIGERGDATVESETMDLKRATGEFMFLGLRMIPGVSTHDFFNRFGGQPEDFYPQIPSWVEDGLMETNGQRLRLTRRGLLVANSLFVNFV